MIKSQTKQYERNLDDRTLAFAKRIIHLCKSLKKDTINIELAKQCIRSGCSVGANYREANDSLGKKDFVHRLRISRKEAKETHYWLELIIEANNELKERIEPLKIETHELVKILSAIIEKVK